MQTSYREMDGLESNDMYQGKHFIRSLLNREILHTWLVIGQLGICYAALPSTI